MARSAKTRTDKATDTDKPAPETEITDAEIVEETPPAPGEPVPDTLDAMSEAGVMPDADPVPATDFDLPQDPAPTPTDDVFAEVPTADETTAPEPQPEPEPEPQPWAARTENRPEPAPLPPPPAPVTVRRVGFFPVVLGGIVAAGLGFAAGWQGFIQRPTDTATATALTDQAARIDGVSAAVAAIPTPELTPLQDDIAALRADLAPLVDRVAAIETRLETMERAPANDGTLSATAIAAWQQDIEDLKTAVSGLTEQTGAIAAQEAALADLQQTMAGMVEAAEQRLDAAQSTVAGIEEAATATATATLRRAVLASLQTAVDSGQPYANLLSELTTTGIEVPDGLSVPAADGVPTLATLIETFPEAARGALAAARAEGLAEDGGNGVMSFLRSQLDVRSVEPREGDDPDAVLSRAEAALRDARLGDALAEIATLPEVVRAPMTAWVAAAEARVAALSALQSLNETLSAPETSN